MFMPSIYQNESSTLIKAFLVEMTYEKTENI